MREAQPHGGGGGGGQGLRNCRYHYHYHFGSPLCAPGRFPASGRTAHCHYRYNYRGGYVRNIRVSDLILFLLSVVLLFVIVAMQPGSAKDKMVRVGATGLR